MNNFFLSFLLSNLMLCAIFAIIISNPLSALLSLISCFILFACILFQFQFSFFALVIVTIYIGAVAILFLAVFMFLNLPLVFSYSSIQIYQLIIFLFFSLIFNYIIYFFFNKIFSLISNYCFFIPTIYTNFDYTNTAEILGLFLYGLMPLYLIFLTILLFITLIAALYFLGEELN